MGLVGLARTQAAAVPWEDFVAGLEWNQGEHVTMIGPTGAGKTTLAHALLPKREHVMVLGSKPRDPSLDRLVRDGYVRISEWPPPPGARRVIVWPRVYRPSDLRRLQAAHLAAIEAAFVEGAWCIYEDELHLACDELRLASHLRLIWQMGRSMKVTLVTAQQRPAFVPLAAYSQATHLVLWRTGDRKDLLRVGGFGGYDVAQIAAEVTALPRFHALWIDTLRRSKTVVNCRKG